MNTNMSCVLKKAFNCYFSNSWDLELAASKQAYIVLLAVAVYMLEKANLSIVVVRMNSQACAGLVGT